ncbi:MAG TPA: GSCFA domain-containing protein, partial [Hansschlegelia sp.]
MSPYAGLPSRSYWRLGVTEQHPTAPVDLYRKKFAIKPSDQIATAGSCFAQHIAKHLRLHNYQVIDKEPKPLGLPEDEASKYGYGLYSARYGNLYTTRQLLQLTLEAFGEFEPANVVWKKKDRFFDALRPSVEPNGLASEREVALHRASHLRHVADMLTSA